jgi:hypothetical protein
MRELMNRQISARRAAVRSGLSSMFLASADRADWPVLCGRYPGSAPAAIGDRLRSAALRPLPAASIPAEARQTTAGR